MQETVVRIEGVHKSFGANHVLRGVDLDLRAGEVTVLMGANGAGKSTLVKILSGVHPAGSGRIAYLGKPYAPSSPSEAMRAGVVTVHQNINDGVVADLDVASNLMLDHLAEPVAGFFINSRRLRRSAQKVADAIGLQVPMSEPVSRLSLADRQLVAIARGLNRKPRLLILDEPTSSLSAAEAERLFALLDRLRDDGVCILYISHRMSDIRRIADRIVSMRDGTISGLFEEKPLDFEGAVNAMLGHQMTEVDFTPPEAGAPVLKLEGVRLKAGARTLDLTFRKGEVLAITGLVGCGKTDLAQMLFGLATPVEGRMILNGVDYAPNTPAQAIGSGVFLCAKDRASNGVVPDFDLSGNISLPFLTRYSWGGFLTPRAQRKRSRELIGDLGIVCQAETDAIGSLSGGNQQKVMVARWLAEPCHVLVLDEPFQGVDIQARRDIGHKIRETAPTRATVVLVAELDEALEIADRIVVFSDHAVAGEHLNGQVDLNLMLAQVAGRGAAEQQEAMRNGHAE